MHSESSRFTFKVTSHELKPTAFSKGLSEIACHKYEGQKHGHTQVGPSTAGKGFMDSKIKHYSQGPRMENSEVCAMAAGDTESRTSGLGSITRRSPETFVAKLFLLVRNLQNLPFLRERQFHNSFIC